jgi:putative CocE/NonD family hydrolase
MTKMPRRQSPAPGAVGTPINVENLRAIFEVAKEYITTPQQGGYMLPTESIKLEINVPVKMRDGTLLYADVWRPDKAGKFPAILTRTPYNKNLMFPTNAGYMNPQRIARAGYGVVIQDVRGTGDSEGRAFLWKQEVEDGYDAVEGVATLPWCDGNVGMFGFSYFGFTQWAAAVARPPHLKAICPGMTHHVPRSFPFSARGDTYKLQIHLSWYLSRSLQELARKNLSPEEMKSAINQLIYLLDTVKEQQRFLPMKDSSAVKIIEELDLMEPRYAGTLSHISDDPFWREAAGGPLPMENLDVPVFHIAGWYDTEMTPGVLNSYHKIETMKKPVPQKMLIGPWIHTGTMPNIVGQLDFGLASAGAVVDVTGQHLKWFDRWLKGTGNEGDKEPPVSIFVMGDNAWRHEQAWPLARTKYTRCFLHSGGQANTRSGDGALNFAAPGEEPYDSFLYDPRNPAPSSEMGMGAFNQQENENRPDILVYSTQTLEKDIEVTGPVRVTLFAASSAVDTDFTAKLIDVWPDGAAYNVAEGIIRARYRRSAALPELIEPGKVYEYDIDLGGTSNVFKPGHCIRLEISSSHFPKWDRNLNTGHIMGDDAEIRLALQTIYHTRQFPSCVVLPVIPR